MIQTPDFNLAVYAKGDPKASKLALVLPGLLDTKDYPHMHRHVDLLAERGFYALSFDPPGTWGSMGGIGSYTMSNYIKAVNQLIELCSDKPTLLVGHSLGGLIAALAAISHPHVVGFASFMSPFSFITSVNGEAYGARIPLHEWQAIGAKESRRDLPDDRSKQRLFHLPYAFAEDAKQYNSLPGLSKLTKPKLMGTGDTDHYRDEHIEAYKAAAKPKEFVLLKSDHNYRWHLGLIKEVNGLLEKFLETHKL
jgi:pimeloyl-ACP methyl ester carboxylesterase